jgi:hypothetical protein
MMGLREVKIVGAGNGLAHESSSPWIDPEEMRVVRTMADCIPPIWRYPANIDMQSDRIAGGVVALVS